MNPNLPTPPIPENFTEQVLMRIWLAELPQPTPPDGFDKRILVKPNGKNLWILNGIILAVAVAFGLWMAARSSSVRIAHVPDIRATTINLYNLPPASITNHPAPPPVKHRPKKMLVGRAGY